MLQHDSIVPSRRATHKVGTTECSGDEDGHASSVRSLDPNIATNMRKDLFVTHGLQSKFAPVAMGGNCYVWGMSFRHS